MNHDSTRAATFFLTLLSAFTAVYSPIALENRKRDWDRKLTAFALAGSIEGILDRTQEYRFAEHARDFLARLERGETVRMKGLLLAGPFNDPILEKHYDKLGLLGDPLSKETIVFYGYITALRNDLARLFEGALDNNPELMADILRHGLVIWTREEPKARSLVERLRQSAR